MAREPLFRHRPLSVMASSESAPKKKGFVFKPIQKPVRSTPLYGQLAPGAAAPRSAPSAAVSALFARDDWAWVAIDVETHDLVPATANPRWIQGQFGYLSRLDADVLAGLRVVQVGWAYGDFRSGGDPETKERLIRPDGFAVAGAATEKHGISDLQARTEGASLRDVLQEMVCDVCTKVSRGARVCGHHLEFDAGIVAAELDRLGMDALRELWEQSVVDGVCTMGPGIGHWVRQQAGFGDKERNTPMRLKDAVSLLLPNSKSKELLKAHHSAGGDARMHWLLRQELWRRALA